MRGFQIAVFALGVVALLASAAFVGSVVGDALWRAGVAAFLLDIACIMLWPQRHNGHVEGPMSR
jgi:hypothetical protein